MKSKRFTEEQIIGVLKQAQAGVKINEEIVSIFSDMHFIDLLFPACVKSGKFRLNLNKARQPDCRRSLD